jgi:pimeloyl-[acyl-carrier protein] methyl ester esterase
VVKLVLLPGMDGTGDLFEDFVAALPIPLETETVRYPAGECLSYGELEPLVRAAIPVSEPFLLVAESFSTPLAIWCAASCPPNLKGLVLCAGFATCPVRGWRRRVCSLLTPILFRIKFSETAARQFLVGKDAPDTLVAAVRAAVSSVQPKALSSRLSEVLGCDVRVSCDGWLCRFCISGQSRIAWFPHRVWMRFGRLNRRWSRRPSTGPTCYFKANRRERQRLWRNLRGNS